MKITVVTVCYNAESVLKKTFNSVLNQEYGDYEYVVIDGNSTDNTVNIIKEYKRKFEKRDIEFRYISEPDKGIYDAMNKAIKIAEGEWIYFLNAGDYLFSNDTFKEIFAEEKNDDADIVYGKVIKKTDHGNELRSHDPVETIVKELPFCHQGVFTKTEIMKAELFDCKYSMCADYDFFLNMYLQGKKFKKIESMVAYYQMGGLSDVNYFKTLKESYQIKSTRGVLKFGDKVYWKLYYIPATWFHLKKVSLKNKKKRT